MGPYLRRPSFNKTTKKIILGKNNDVTHRINLESPHVFWALYKQLSLGLKGSLVRMFHRTQPLRGAPSLCPVLSPWASRSSSSTCLSGETSGEGKDLSSQVNTGLIFNNDLGQLISCVTWGRLHKHSWGCFPQREKDWARWWCDQGLKRAYALISQYNQALSCFVSWPRVLLGVPLLEGSVKSAEMGAEGYLGRTHSFTQWSLSEGEEACGKRPQRVHVLMDSSWL